MASSPIAVRGKRVLPKEDNLCLANGRSFSVRTDFDVGNAFAGVGEGLADLDAAAEVAAGRYADARHGEHDAAAGGRAEGELKASLAGRIGAADESEADAVRVALENEGGIGVAGEDAVQCLDVVVDAANGRPGGTDFGVTDGGPLSVAGTVLLACGDDRRCLVVPDDHDGRQEGAGEQGKLHDHDSPGISFAFHGMSNMNHLPDRRMGSRFPFFRPVRSRRASRARTRVSFPTAVICGWAILAGCAGGAEPAPPAPPPPPPPLIVSEATIAELHAAMDAGRLTARQLVERSLARIESYDRAGPALNALVVLDPGALEAADSLDVRFARFGRLTGPLHGIPVVVKDNYDVAGLPTTAGSAALARVVPSDDAYVVRRLREAGAVVLGKTNMAEFAFSPYETVGTAIEGHTRNPYDPERVPGGSSGGTAAAVAAGFATAGLGTDTGNSVRGPAAHTALVGIRPTMGLVSRDGIVPLYLDRDIGGPMARTVADAAAVLDVIAGVDPADSVTERQRGRTPARFSYFLLPDGMRGKRLGVVRQLSDVASADPELLAVFNHALLNMVELGATTIDPVRIPMLDSLPNLFCPRFKTDIAAYLEGFGDDAPVSDLAGIIASGAYDPALEDRLRALDAFTTPARDPTCRAAARAAERLRAEVRGLFERHDLDALVYPTWSNPPRAIGDLESPHGNNSFQLAPPLGYPAITVPMGYVGDGLPVGIQLLAEAFAEPDLIAMAFAYEQATLHRRPPPTTPPLR
jgi:amidase